MSWAEIKKAVNDDISIPLNKAIGEIYDENGDRCYEEYSLEDDSTAHVLSPVNNQMQKENAIFEYEDAIYCALGTMLYKWQDSLKEWITCINPKTGTTPINIGRYPILIGDKVHFINDNFHYCYDMQTGGNPTYNIITTGSYSHGIVLFTINSKYYIWAYNNNYNFCFLEWNKDTDTYSIAYEFPSSWSGTKMLNTSHSVCVWENKLYIFYTGRNSASASEYPFVFLVWDGNTLQEFTRSGFSQPNGDYFNISIVYENTLHIFTYINSSPYGKHYYFNGTSWSTISDETFPFTFSSSGGAQAFVYHNNLYLMNTASASYTDASSEYAFKKWDNPKWVEPIQYKQVYQKGLRTKNAYYLMRNGAIKSKQTGTSSSLNNNNGVTINIARVVPRNCFVFLSQIIGNSTTLVRIEYTLNETQLTIKPSSAINTAVQWQIIEFY